MYQSHILRINKIYFIFLLSFILLLLNDFYYSKYFNKASYPIKINKSIEIEIDSNESKIL